MTVWTPDMGKGMYDFETGTFVPDAPADQAGAAPAPAEVDDFGFGFDDETAALLAGLDDAPPALVDEPPAPAPEPVEQEDQAVGPAAAEQPEPQAEQGPEQEEQAAPGAAPDAPATDAGPALTLEELTRAVEELGMLDALHKWIGDELKARGGDCETAFAAWVNGGGKRSIELTLPNGTQVGTFHIEAPKVTTIWDDAAVLDYTRKHAGHNLYDVVDAERACRYPDVVEYLRIQHPEVIRQEVRPAYLDLLAQKIGADGVLVDEETGEMHQLGKRVAVPSTGKGKPAWKRPKGAPTGRETLIAAWRDGELNGRIALDPPAPAER